MSTFTPGMFRVEPAPQSANELERERMARYRPADGSATATRDAMTHVQADTITATATLEHAQARVQRLLTTGAAFQDVTKARSELANAQARLDDLGGREAALALALGQREVVEANALAELERLAAVAQGHAEKFKAFLARDYAKAAGIIAGGLEHERAARRAMDILTEAAKLWPGLPYPRPDVPRASDGSGYAYRACLPGHVTPAPLTQSPYVQ